MHKLSPQKEIIVSTLRDLNWHCGREWFNRIKDDRKRISELNETYMASKGYEIAAKPCKGAYCGVKDCPLYARRAQKVSLHSPIQSQPSMKLVDIERSKRMCELFMSGASSEQIFSVV